MKKFWTWMAGQLSDGLDKSTTGTYILFGSFGLVAYLAFKNGATDQVENLITVSMIVGATLLGVNSVTDIYKKKNDQPICD